MADAEAARKEAAPGAEANRITGGCLCGALRWEAQGPPDFAGYCFCTDCRKMSGSGFVGFMGFAAAKVRFSGETRQLRSRSIRGTDAVRNTCPTCGSLVFGGIAGEDRSHTLYAGSLDDPSAFRPRRYHLRCPAHAPRNTAASRPENRRAESGKNRPSDSVNRRRRARSGRGTE